MFNDHFFNHDLQSAPIRISTTKASAKFLLDKNEQSDDIDPDIKKQIIESLMNANWNRYPSSDYKDIEMKVAEYCNLQTENIVLSSGSASIITTLLDYFALNQKNIFINQPTYSLFEYHCKTYNIPFTPWTLTKDFEFDFENFPKLDEHSVLFITSPNNPVGNSISKQKMECLLRSYSNSMFVLDAVYAEFSDEDLTQLVLQYENLIVLRSFSKAFPIAGLRLGYLCAAPKLAAIVKKLVLQFSINHFSLIFAREMLFNPTFMDNAKQRVKDIIHERDSMYFGLLRKYNSGILKVYKSEGNFLLIRLGNRLSFDKMMEDLKQNGIKFLDTSNFPLLKNTFRVSVGNPKENRTFMQLLESSVRPYLIKTSKMLV